MLFNGLFIRFFLFDLKQPKDFTVLSTLFSPGVRHMFPRKKPEQTLLILLTV